MKPKFRGVGLSLHLDQINEAIQEAPVDGFSEVIADNWLSPGPHHQKLARLREKQEVLFHCVNSNVGGVDPLDTKYLSQIKELADRFHVEHLSDHLCMQAHNGIHFHDLLPIPFTQESLNNCAERIDRIQELWGRELILENLSYYIEYPEADYTEAGFLNELHRRTSCGILLDLNNIWVNEQNLNIPVNDFLGELNQHSIKEVHLAGPELSGDVYVDTHGSGVQSAVLELLPSLSTKEPVPIIYERDRNIPPFAKLLEETNHISDFVRQHA